MFKTPGGHDLPLAALASLGWREIELQRRGKLLLALADLAREVEVILTHIAYGDFT